jgi:secreted Zn-dependent insulinase-like peptidase
VQKLAEDVLSRVYIQTLVHGNLTKEVAIDLQQTLEDILKPAALPEAERTPEVSLVLPDGEC